MSIETSLYSRLTADAVVTALVGDRVYPGDPPTNTEDMPAISYTVTGGPVEFGLTTYSVDISVSHPDNSICTAVLQACRAQLDQKSWVGVQGSFAGDTSTTPEDGYYTQTQSYTIVYESDADIVYESIDQITSDTETNLTGYLKGDGSTLSAQAVPIPVSDGGTGQTTASNAINALLPSQTSNSGKYLTTNGSAASWGTTPSGTVTSVGVSGSNGIGVSGSPITSSGTVALSLGNITPTSVSTGAITSSITSNDARVTNLLLQNAGSGQNTAASLQFHYGQYISGPYSKDGINQPIVLQAGTGTGSRVSVGAAGEMVFTGTSAYNLNFPDSNSTVLINQNNGVSGSITFASGGYVATQVYDGSSFNEQMRVSGTTQAVRITPSLAATKGLVIKGASSQTANLFECQTSVGTAVASVSAAGIGNFTKVQISSGPILRLLSSTLEIVNSGESDYYDIKAKNVTSTGTVTATNLQFNGPTGSFFRNSGGVNQLVNSGATDWDSLELKNLTLRGVVVPSATSAVGLIVRGLASQTANLFECQNSVGTAVASISASGTLTADSANINASSNPTLSLGGTSAVQRDGGWGTGNLWLGNQAAWSSVRFFSSESCLFTSAGVATFASSVVVKASGNTRWSIDGTFITGSGQTTGTGAATRTQVNFYPYWNDANNSTREGGVQITGGSGVGDQNLIHTWADATGGNTIIYAGAANYCSVLLTGSAAGFRVWDGSDKKIEATTTGLGFFNATPIAKPSALTAADASSLSSSDATVIANMRTRIGELESKLQSLGLIA